MFWLSGSFADLDWVHSFLGVSWLSAHLAWLWLGLLVSAPHVSHSLTGYLARSLGCGRGASEGNICKASLGLELAHSLWSHSVGQSRL